MRAWDYRHRSEHNYRAIPNRRRFPLSESDPVEQSEHMLRVQHETVTGRVASGFISLIVDLYSEQTEPIVAVPTPRGQ